MIEQLNLDMDVLRTLVTAQRLGSFNRAADRIGRSQSAVSQQVRKLEDQIGLPLFRKQGRGLAPTESGEIVLAYARRILELNDEAVLALRGRALDGAVRFGLPSDLAEAWLSTALGRFRRAHPGLRIETAVDGNARLLDRLDRGELDLVLALGHAGRGDAEPVAAVAPVWIGPASGETLWQAGEPIPLALLDAPCLFRRIALAELDRAGLAWRLAFGSAGLHGLWAAVAAGLGVTLRTAIGLPAGLHLLGPADGLPPVREPAVPICLHDGGRSLSPALARLRAIILETLSANLPDLPQAARPAEY
jgi:DNA-binding transcriptional LysR family regulator